MKSALLFVLVGLPFISAQYGEPKDTSMTTSASSTASSAAASASSTVHKVDVGEDGFVFNPDSLTVSPGEKVEFHFYPLNHSVAQASFDNPCHPINASGFSSGFVLESVSESKAQVSDQRLNSTEHRLHSDHQRHDPSLVLLRSDRPLPGRHGWSYQSTVSTSSF